MWLRSYMRGREMKDSQERFWRCVFTVVNLLPSGAEILKLVSKICIFNVVRLVMQPRLSVWMISNVLTS